VIRSIQHVQMAVPEHSEAAVRAFYGGLLGLHEIEKPAPLRAGGGVWFAVGAQELHAGVEPSHRPAGKAHPGLEVRSRAELDELAGRLEAAGHPVTWDDRIQGVARFHTHDPFGNRVELLAAE